MAVGDIEKAPTRKQWKRLPPAITDTGEKSQDEDFPLPDITQVFPASVLKSRLLLIDAVFSVLIFTPLIILYWHGVTGICNKILPSFPVTRSIVFIAFSVVSQVFLSAYQERITEYVRQRSPQHYVLVTHVYVVFMSACQIAQYVGAEGLFTWLCEGSLNSAVRMVCTSVIILTGFQISTAVMDSPFRLTLNDQVTLDDAFQYEGYYVSKPGLYMGHVLDVIATAGLMQTCVHLFIIGAWSVLDNLLGLAFFGFVWSWVIGTTIFVIFNLLLSNLQQLLKAINDRHGEIIVNLAADIVIYVVAFGGIALWKSVWMFYEMLAEYFPIRNGKADVTCFYEMFTAYLLLALCHISFSLPAKGYTPYLLNDYGIRLGESVEYFLYFFKDKVEHIESTNRTKDEEKSQKKETSETTPVKQEHNKLLRRQLSKEIVDKHTARPTKVTLQHLVETNHHRKPHRK